MVISVLEIIIEFPENYSLKDKRRQLNSLKEKLHHRFKLSVAEVDLNDSLKFAHLAAALVSNSKSFGEAVLQKAISFTENSLACRLLEIKVFSQVY